MDDNKFVEKPESPIKDLNCDGILHSSELLEQLASQEKAAGFNRTTGERVHGVLIAASLSDFSRQHAAKIGFAQLTNDPLAAMKDLQESGAREIEERIRKIVRIASRPAFQAIAQTYMDPAINETEQRKHIDKADNDKKNSNHTSPYDTINADFANLVEFAKSFKSTFPKGVKINPEDTTQIVAHFSNIPVIIRTPEKQDAKGKGMNM
jgi:hypothetical protein